MGKSAGHSGRFRYFMGLHMGVCRGPVDEMVAIKVGDKVAWEGSVTGTSQIYLNKPDLFGGDDSQGGIVGPLDVLFGQDDQVAPSWLTKLHGALLPGFRRVFTTAFNGLFCSNNPNPQVWKYRVRRSQAGWKGGACWYPEKARIVLDDGQGNPIHAMNPVHIIYQCTTDPSFGRGLDPGYIDDAQWRAAADELYAEGFGLCLRWVRTDAVQSFVQVVADHIGAMVAMDYSTGKLVLTLIRDNYDPATLPHFDYDSGLIAIEDDQASANEANVNEIVVKYVDPVTGDERPARVPNIAAIQNMGGVSSQSKDYPGIPTHALALRVAARDCKIATAGLRRFKVKLDRRGYGLRPGSVFRISAPDRDIANMVLRAGTKTEGTLAEGDLTFVAVQDLYGVPATTWVGPSPNEHSPPDHTPLPPPFQNAFEAPYRDLARRLSAADLAALGDDSGCLATAAGSPSGLSLNYRIATEAQGETDFVVRGTGSWCAGAKLVDALAAEIGPSAVSLTDLAGLDSVAIGSAVLINNETMRVDAIDPGAGTATLARGCADTLPVAHGAGSQVYFYGDAAGSDDREYATGESVGVKLLTHTASGDLDAASAPAITVAMDQRQARPYPPAGLTLNGNPWHSAAAIEGVLSLAWHHRDRLTQADQLVDAAQADIGPENDVCYGIECYDANGYQLAQMLNVAGNGADVTLAYTGNVRIVLYALRNGLESTQRYDVTVAYTPPAGTMESSIAANAWTQDETLLVGGGA